MSRVGIYDQVKSAIQDIVAPALHELRGEMQAMRGELGGEIRAMRGEMQTARADVQRVDGKVDSLQAQMGSMKNELIAEIRRLDTRIDGVDRELRTAIDIRERLAALEARRS
jgi:prefoldin subunit 5